MPRLAIRRVRYQGETYSYESPELGDGVRVLVGENGSGKTTFSDFIYFALGGRVSKYDRKSKGRHKEVTNDKNNYVEIEVEIDANRFILRRHIGRNEVGVTPAEGETEVFHTHRQHATPGQGVFSDWLLEKLHIRPVTLFQGSRSWTLGFRDLSRLIYHDQEPDPEHVFRRPDQDGITESAYVRRAIFEILTGKSFEELYRLHGEVRKLEGDLAGLTTQAKSFESALTLFLDGSSDQNVEHLQTIAKGLTRELRSLEDARDVYLTVDVPDADEGDGLSARRQEFIDQLLGVRHTKRALMRRVAELEDGRISLLHEATAIEKILYTDKKTGLFSGEDVCPFCYTKVDRDFGHCICGAPVGEGNYRAFFYSPDEYNELLREKRKAIATIEASANRYRVRLEALVHKEEGLIGGIETADEALRGTRRAKSGQQRANRKLAAVEDQRRRLEARLKEIHQRLRIERERERLLKDRSKLENQLKRKRGQLAVKEGEAAQEMAGIREAFESRYTELLRRLVPDVRVATMSDSYDPIMNLGQYIQASARVPFRLLYFAVLLEMSLKDTEVPYPRFLLIDTPETVGIDLKKLLKAIETVEEISASVEAPHQIILTTGPGRCPPGLEGRVFCRITEENRLLQRTKPVEVDEASSEWGLPH